MEIIWHGTASVEFRTDEGKILFDPFIPLKGSPVDVKAEDFDGFDEILITHGHLDHIVNLPEIYGRNPSVKIRCTQTPYKTLIKKGVPKENLVLISFGDQFMLNGFKITVLHGKHAVLPKLTFKRFKRYITAPERGNIPYLIRENALCKENGETVFFVIEAEGKRVSLIGSLNLLDDEEYPVGCDLLIMAYNGWENNLPPAVRVIERLQPKKIFLDHYDDTFPPLTGDLELSPVLERYEGKISPLVHNKVEVL